MLAKYLKRFRVSAKRYGFRRVILSLFKRAYSPFFVRRTVLMFHIFKNASFKDYVCPPSIVFSELTKADHDELLIFSPYLTAKKLKQHLRQQHTCFIAKDNNQIIFHTWVGKSRIFIPVIGKWIDFAADQVYFYNTYTDNAYSAFNILPAFLTKMHDIYDSKQSPYREALTVVDTAVKIPVRAYKKITGATKITLITYVRILGFKKHQTRVITEGEASQLCRRK